MAWKAIIFCRDSFFSLERRPRRSLSRTQRNFATCSAVSQIWKWVSKIWSNLLKLKPLKTWNELQTNGKGFYNCLFSNGFTTSRLKREYEVWMKRDTDKKKKRFLTAKYSPNLDIFWPTNSWHLRLHFDNPSENFRILFVHTKVTELNQTLRHVRQWAVFGNGSE